MEPRLSFLTLGVADLERSRRFYTEVLELTPRPGSGEGVVFFELGPTWFALFPRAALAADAGVDAEGGGFPGFAMAHNVGSTRAVDELLAHVAAHADSHGGRLVRPGQQPPWGGYRGYFADPDGFLWEVAWNPQFPHA